MKLYYFRHMYNKNIWVDSYEASCLFDAINEAYFNHSDKRGAIRLKYLFKCD